MARTLGKTEDAANNEQQFQNSRAHFQKSFVEPDGKIKSDLQTAYCMAHYYDLLTPEQRKELLECRQRKTTTARQTQGAANEKQSHGKHRRFPYLKNCQHSATFFLMAADSLHHDAKELRNGCHLWSELKSRVKLSKSPQVVARRWTKFLLDQILLDHLEDCPKQAAGFATALPSHS
jgi:hypothetical protein